MKSFNCLDKNELVTKPYFLEASAGTGKTFAIEHIFLRLVLEEEMEILCDNILVVTFTNAATRELKSRIHKTLETALSELVTGTISLPYLMDLSEEERLNAIKKVEKALLHFDKAEIFTIHGFCFHSLKTMGMDASINLDMEELQDQSYQNELRDVVIDTLRTDVKRGIFGLSQVHHALKSFRNDVHLFFSRVYKLVENEEHLEEVEDFSFLAEEFREAFLSCTQEFFKDKLVDAFTSIAPNFKGICNTKKEIHQEYLVQMQLLQEAFSKENFEKNFDEICFSNCFVLEKFSEDNCKKSAKFSESEEKSKRIFTFLKEALLPIYKKAKDPSRTLLRIASLCKKRIKDKYEEEKIFSFDAYLRQMLKALENEKFLRKIKGKYKAAIIDEFQDTDPVQWKIFKKLFTERGSFPLYLVGDPKQSIYAFRNADLPTYLEAAGCFSKDSLRSLDTNYRSEPSLVSTLNILFSKEHAKDWLSSSGSIEYKQVKASDFFEDTVFQDEGSHVHAAIFEEKQTRDTSFPSKSLEEEEIYPYIAKEISKIRSSSSISFNEIAILVRDRYQGYRLQNAFSKFNIPLEVRSQTPLYKTKAYHFFSCLFSWLNTPSNKNFLRTLLVHPLMGFENTALRLNEESKEVLEAIGKLKYLSEVFEEEGFLSFLQKFKESSFSGERSFEASLLRDKSIEDYQDFMQIYEGIVENVKSPYELEEVILYLEECRRKKQEEDSSSFQKGVKKEDAVTVMTTHLSKGLEFPYVFALGVASRSTKQEAIVKVKEKFEVYDENKDAHISHSNNINEEKMRQLYVALTRAKKRVYLFFCLEEEKDSILETSRSAMEHFCKSLCGAFDKNALTNKLESLKLSSLQIDKEHKDLIVPSIMKTSQEVELQKPKKFEKVINERIFCSYSGLAQVSKVQRLHTSPDLQVKDVFNIPSSKETGNFLHAILEKVFERGLYKNFSYQALKALIEQEVQGTKLVDYQGEVFEMIENTVYLSFETEDGSFSFSDISLKDVLTEMPFFLSQDSVQTIKGFIDLCVIHKNNLYLVDWKSNFLGGSYESYSKENMKESMQEHDYFLQAKIYSEAAKEFVKEKATHLEYGGMFYVFLRGLRKNTSSGVYFVS